MALLLRGIGVLPTFRSSWNVFWNLFLNVLLVLGALAVLTKARSIVVVREYPNDLYGVWRRRKWEHLVLARLAFTAWR